jgi:hypothetical protein
MCSVVASLGSMAKGDIFAVAVIFATCVFSFWSRFGESDCSISRLFLQLLSGRGSCVSLGSLLVEPPLSLLLSFENPACALGGSRCFFCFGPWTLD